MQKKYPSRRRNRKRIVRAPQQQEGIFQRKKDISGKKVFVSYIPRDVKYKNKLVRWQRKQHYGTYHINITSADDKDVRRRDGQVVRSSIIRKIKQADFVVIIIGDKNDNHPWEQFEGLARRFNVTRYYMRIPYTTAPLPRRMKHIQQIAYNPNAIEKLFRDIDNPPPPPEAEGEAEKPVE